MSIPTTIPSSFTSTDQDGATRTEPLRVTASGRVTPLTPSVIAVLPLAQLELEHAHYWNKRTLSTADMRMLSCISARIREIEAIEAGTAAETRALEAELDAAKAAYAAVLEQLTPYNESLERGDGWLARANAVRHDQLLRRLEDAQQRVWDAQDALKAATAAVA